MRNVRMVIFLLTLTGSTSAQTNRPAQLPGGTQVQAAPQKPARVSLSPRFSPGQSFLYQMQFENTTTGSRSGLASDPQGPSKSTIIWDTAIRLYVLSVL
jgi:hypothetical protein